MGERFKTGLTLVLTGIWVLLLSAFLTLSVGQARILVSLYAASASPSSATGTSSLLRPSAFFGNDALILFSIAAILSLILFRRPRRLLPVSIVSVLIFVGLNLYSGRHVLPQLLIWPSPVSLSEQYAQALAADDLEAALQLADGSDDCKTRAEKAFQDHRARLTQRLGDEKHVPGIRDTNLKSFATFYDKPVPQRSAIMQPVPKHLATIMAETESGTIIWLNLKMSYGSFLGTRYICGQGIDSSVRRIWQYQSSFALPMPGKLWPRVEVRPAQSG
jgi:hypothetical protein